jgi:hypothetical protein
LILKWHFSGIIQLKFIFSARVIIKTKAFTQKKKKNSRNILTGGGTNGKNRKLKKKILKGKKKLLEDLAKVVYLLNCFYLP